MNKTDWKQKLSSRKLWALIAALIVSIGVILNATPDTAEKITGLIGAIGSVIAYIFAESSIDTARASGGQNND